MGKITCHEFLDAINERQLLFYQTDLYDNSMRRSVQTIPKELRKKSDGSGSISFEGAAYIYYPKDFFSVLSGVYIAVKQTISGNLLCDRFVPVMMLLDEHEQTFNREPELATL